VALQREYLLRLLDAPFPRDVRRIKLTGRPRILITQLDKLGDVLCSTAAIRLLRRALPDSHVAVAVQPYSRTVLANNPDVDEVLTMSVPWSATMFEGGMTGRLRRAWRIGNELRDRRFDVGIDLQGNPLNALFMAVARIPIRIGMTGLGGNVWLTSGQRMDWFANRVAFRQRLIERLTGQTCTPVTRFDFSPEDAAWATDRLGAIATGRPVVVVCPTAENPLRMWAERRYVALGQALADEACVLFCYAPSDAETAERAEAAWHDETHCHTLETPTLGQFGAALAASDVVVSGDSAPMHMAVAVGTPVVAIFGPSPPSAAGPLDWDYNRVLQADVPCGPCLWGPHAPTCDVRRCLDSISVEQVLHATRELLQQGKELRS
jgi:ADP-heptose:LPS heptosyltransferase